MIGTESKPYFGKILCDSGIVVGWAAGMRDTSREPAAVCGHRHLYLGDDSKNGKEEGHGNGRIGISYCTHIDEVNHIYFFKILNLGGKGKVSLGVGGWQLTI